MDLEEAKRRCLEVLTSIKPDQVSALVDYLSETVRDVKPVDNQRIAAVKKLQNISRKLRHKTDISGNLPGEKIFWPVSGSFSDCAIDLTEQVDAFLYDEVQLAALREKRVLKAERYCAVCKSEDIVESNIISHSLSISELEYLFCDLLPRFVEMKGKSLTDVGSRLGAIVYGALVFCPELKEIKGIEISEGHCQLQMEILNGVDFEKKTKILKGDFRLFEDDLKNSNIITMNNVFSFFLDPNEQVKCWNELKRILPSGAILVHNHSIDYVTNHLNLGFEIEDWVDVVFPDHHVYAYMDDEDDSEHKFFVYQIK
ncbi:unnamed protein product [Bursaphelenchus xylophilus]|uniref:(pine wood nematode) hypothetical protein n=1 Tax=Bursaphelenchus xylophilus TaxID=6326 RepID=A0A1I7SMK3_BURXY|nr:unnamed protein product [Bursaphelenchus xylophilus]CAG9130262.1 unnamed protein product [Bursaphelenchus xylophilus]